MSGGASKNVILVIVVALIIGGIVYLESQKAGPSSTSGEQGLPETRMPVQGSPEGPAEVLPNKLIETAPTVTSTSAPPKFMPVQEKEGKYARAPELKGIVGYLNAPDGFTLASQRGKVVLVDFWTYSCINCIRTLPHLTAWHDRYADKGLVIVGVHTPEFDFEKDKENVRTAMARHNITYPVVQDNDYATWRAYKNRFWPRKYLVDKDGYIRYDHIGEGGYDETEKMIQELLKEVGKDVTDMGISDVRDTTPSQALTPELYAGYEFAVPRGQNIGNSGGLRSGVEASYTLPTTMRDDIIYLDGRWNSLPDALVSGDGAQMVLRYLASDVNVVLVPPATPVVMQVLLDGQPIPDAFAGSDVIDGGFIVDEARLYNLVHGPYGRHTLTLIPQEDGVELHAFTFG